MDVKGFPTLKIIVPYKKPGKPQVEDYQGPRTTKGIVDAVVEKIPNHVKRVTDKDVADWLATDNSTAKAILFTEKGTTSALLRSLAIDFLGSINVGQIRNKESAAVEKFGINKFPTLVLLPGGEQDSQVYDGELKKKDISKFLSQVAEPNPDSAPAQGKKKESKSSTKSATSTSSSSAEDSTGTAKGPASDDQSSEDASGEQTSSSAKPSVTHEPETPPLRVIASEAELRRLCLAPKTGTCVLGVLDLPEGTDFQSPRAVTEAMMYLAEIEYKHVLRQAKLFPFYLIPASVAKAAKLNDKLDLKLEGGVDLIAVNARRGWWRRYDPGEDLSFGKDQLETWIDGIRLGEGQKHKLPEELVAEAQEAQAPEPEPESEPEAEQETPKDAPPTEQASEGAEEPEEPKEPRHEEL